MNKIRILLGASILLLSIQAEAALLFDNGSPVGTDLGMLYNSNCRGSSDGSCGWTVYEDFTLTERSVITGLGWSQFDEPLTYLGTKISFFDTLGAAPLISFDVTASRTANGIVGFPNPDISGGATGYDYFASLGFYLNPDTYFVGIHNEVIGHLSTGGQAPTLMANTLGTGQTIPGSFQANVGNIADGTFQVKGSNFALQVYGDISSVPAPATLWLLGTGIIGLIGFTRRRKTA